MPQRNVPALRQHAVSRSSQQRSTVRSSTPTPPHFPSHTAARVAAAWEGSRPVDSDPSVDELLHRVRAPRSNQVSCPECNQAYNPGSMHVCQPKTAPAPAAEMARRVRDHRDAILEGLAAARAYAASAAA